jgi:hypothetical protein
MILFPPWQNARWRCSHGGPTRSRALNLTWRSFSSVELRCSLRHAPLAGRRQADVRNARIHLLRRSRHRWRFGGEGSFSAACKSWSPRHLHPGKGNYAPAGRRVAGLVSTGFAECSGTAHGRPGESEDGDLEAACDVEIARRLFRALCADTLARWRALPYSARRSRPSWTRNSGRRQSIPASPWFTTRWSGWREMEIRFRPFTPRDAGDFPHPGLSTHPGLPLACWRGSSIVQPFSSGPQK